MTLQQSKSPPLHSLTHAQSSSNNISELQPATGGNTLLTSQRKFLMAPKIREKRRNAERAEELVTAIPNASERVTPSNLQPPYEAVMKHKTVS